MEDGDTEGEEKESEWRDRDRGEREGTRGDGVVLWGQS